MKTLRQVEVTPVFVTYCPENSLMEQDKVYISREYKSANMLCLCGCKQPVFLPLTDGEFTVTEPVPGKKISITPSILQRDGCKSHYIITNNVANFV